MKPKLDNRKIIALIPARSGSKGVQNKNIRVLGNRSLIEHACDWCDKQNWIDDFYISTDSQYYMQMAVEAKAKSLSLRNKSLSSDIASSVSVAIDFLYELSEENDFKNIWLVLVQPTSPIRPKFNLKDISSFVNKSGSSVSVAKVQEPHPYKLKCIDNGKIKPFIPECKSETPRQLLPSVYQLTGSIYIINAQILIDNKTFFVDPCLPIYQESFINIDTEYDLKLAEYVYFK